MALTFEILQWAVLIVTLIALWRLKTSAIEAVLPVAESKVAAPVASVKDVICELRDVDGVQVQSVRSFAHITEPPERLYRSVTTYRRVNRAENGRWIYHQELN